MTRYFFHIRRDRETIMDQEGDDLPGPEDARDAAMQAVRELAASHIRNGTAVPDDTMDVCNATGELIASISFRKVVSEQLGPRA
jgi:hypothetical protein